MDEWDIEEALERLNIDEATCLYWKTFPELDNKFIPDRVNATRKRKIKIDWVAKKIQSGYAKLGIKKDLHGTVKERIFRNTFTSQLRQMYDAGFWIKYPQGRKRERLSFLLSPVTIKPQITHGSAIIQPVPKMKYQDGKQLENGATMVRSETPPEDPPIDPPNDPTEDGIKRGTFQPNWPRILLLVLLLISIGVYLGVRVTLFAQDAWYKIPVTKTENTVIPDSASIGVNTIQPENTVISPVLPGINDGSTPEPSKTSASISTPESSATLPPTLTEVPTNTPADVLLNEQFDDSQLDSRITIDKQFSIAGGKLEALEDQLSLIIDEPWRDIKIEFKLDKLAWYQFYTQTRGSVPFLAVRRQDQFNYYWILFLDGEVRFGKRVDNKAFDFSSAIYQIPINDQPITVIVQKDTLKVNDLPAINDSNFSSGGIQFFLHKGITLDYIKVTDLP